MEDKRILEVEKDIIYKKAQDASSTGAQADS